MGASRIRTPDQRLRVFVSSTLGELADERRAVRAAIEQLRLTPVMFELGARPHPPRALYRSYLEQSDVFLGVYWQRYGWVAPDMEISGLEDELVLSAGMPRLVYVKRPAPDMDPELAEMLDRLRGEDTTSYKPFRDSGELRDLVLDDLPLLLTEGFAGGRERSAELPWAPAPLPTPTSTFVGREAALVELGDLLASGRARLLTLTGPGGAGKTRLSLEAAARAGPMFPDGVVLVDLSAEREPHRVLPAIVRAVAPLAGSDEPPLEALQRGLRGRRMLLVLDNVEQVTGCAAEVARLVQLCDRLTVLVTSRESLRVRDEVLYPVGPLALPADGAVTVDRALGAGAVRLFVDRTAAVAPGFELDEDNVADVMAVCRRLDGLPLAIELAAGRMRLFSVAELRDRLERRLDQLAGGLRDLPDRQQTLGRTLEWSTGLLDDDERRVFAAFSVFAGAQLADTEAVMRATTDLAAVDLIGCVGSLLDKNLLRSAPGADGRPRFSMLQTIRDHAGDLLDGQPETAAALRRAHAEHYTELARRWHGRFGAVGRDDALAALSDEHDNLRAAWTFWVGERATGPLDDLLEPLWGYYDAQGDYREAVALGDDLLAVLSLLPETAERVRDEIAMEASLARSMIAVRGYTVEVERAIREAVTRAGEAGETPRRFSALRALGTLHLLRADMPRTREIAAELLATAEELRDPALLADAHQLAGVSTMGVDVTRALGHLETSIEQFTSSPSSRLQFRVGPHPGAVSYVVSGLLLWMTGFPDRARRRVERGLELAAAMEHPYTTAYVLFHASLLALWSEDVDGLARRALDLREVAEAHDYPIWRALALVQGGTARIAEGAAEEGLAEVERGFELYQGLSTPPVFWSGLLMVRASGCLMAGRLEEAGHHLDEAEAAGWPGDPQEADIAMLRGDLELARPTADQDAAAALYELAAELAVLRGTRISQVQALTRLVALRRGTPQGAPARAALTEVLAGFTEGLTSAPVQAARRVLDAET
jgi:predicted ATPase